MIDDLFYHHWKYELEEREPFYAADPKYLLWTWKIMIMDHGVVFPYGFEVGSAYGLTDQHTMEFCYEGNNIFYFKIFDVDGSEIDYKNAAKVNTVMDLVSNIENNSLADSESHGKDDNVVSKS